MFGGHFQLNSPSVNSTEIKVLENGLDFTPIQRKINKPELRRDFIEFCRRMRLKWHFRDEPRGFNATPAVAPKSTWHPSKRHACLEVFLSQVEREIFKIPFSELSILIYLEKSGKLLHLWPMIEVLRSKKQIRGLAKLYGTETITY